MTSTRGMTRGRTAKPIVAPPPDLDFIAESITEGGSQRRSGRGAVVLRRG